MLEAATLLKTDPGLRPVSLDHGLETERRDSNLPADEDTGGAELEDVTNVGEDEDVTMSQVSRCHETGMWLSGVSHVTSCYAVTLSRGFLRLLGTNVCNQENCEEKIANNIW